MTHECFNCGQEIANTPNNYRVGPKLFHPKCIEPIIKPFSIKLPPPITTFTNDIFSRYMETAQDILPIIIKKLIEMIENNKDISLLKQEGSLLVKFLRFKKLYLNIGGFTEIKLWEEMQNVYHYLDYLEKDNIITPEYISTASLFLILCCQAKIPVSMRKELRTNIIHYP